jgi:hypothetical protein
MRTVLLLVCVACVGAFWNDQMPMRLLRETTTSIDDNRLQLKSINNEIQQLLQLQRVNTHNPSEYWAIEQQFIELTKIKDILKNDMYDLARKAINQNRI